MSGRRYKTTRGAARPLALAALLLLASTACVRSKVVVTSDPADVDVTMNGRHLGTTPVESPFTWYWYYDFRGEKDGYQTRVQRERFRAPVYLWPGLDLVMEILPVPIRDTKQVHLNLQPEADRPAPEFAGSPVSG